MSYRLILGESVAVGLRRIVLEQLDAAARDLEGQGEREQNHDARLHDARKRLKKVRGVLGLVRGSLGEESYRRESTCFRVAARELGGAREAAARLECFEALRAAYAAELPPDGFAGVQRLLANLKERTVESAFDRGVDAEVVETLRLAIHRSLSWTLDQDGYEALSGGLGRTYARGRRAFRHAYADPSSKSFHEWRKRVKDHWYHLRLLQNIWPKPMRALRRALKELEALLGDDHDLGDLHDLLRDLPPHPETDLRIDRLLELIDQREQQLRAQAGDIGRRVYAERQEHLVRRFGGYFKAWQGDCAAPAANSTSARPRCR